MGKKIAVCSGKEDLAKDGLKKARAKKEEWAGADWKLEQDNVLREFRQGITHGGKARFKAEGKARSKGDSSNLMQMLQPRYF